MQSVSACSNCGTPVEPGKTFCDNCGISLAVPIPVPPPVPVAAPRRRGFPFGKVLLLGCLGIIVIGVLAIGGVGLYAWRRASYTPPPRTQPQLPQRAAGTMTEFPVDSDPNSPAQPTSVVSQNLTPSQPGSSSQSGNSSQVPLPPGVDRGTLPQRASSITSVTYNAHPGTGATGHGPTAAGTTGGEIYVHVLDGQPQAGDTIAVGIAQATKGDRTGVRVQSPTGAVYSGSRIRNPQVCVYVLAKQSSNLVIIIYAPDPSTLDVADRLARSVGNGAGLNDYPVIKGSLWTLPASLPADLMLQEVNTLTRADIERSFAGAGNAGGDEETRKVLEQMRQLIPERLVGSRYTDAGRQEWGALEFEYSSGFQAWRTWLLARSLLGLAGSQTVTVRGVSALYMDQDNKRLLIFQKGPYFVVLSGPSASPVDRIIGLGDAFQL